MLLAKKIVTLSVSLPTAVAIYQMNIAPVRASSLTTEEFRHFMVAIDGEEDEDSAWHIEAQYRYQLNDHVAINPGFFVVINPENNSDNDTIYVGTVRTIFEF